MAGQPLHVVVDGEWICRKYSDLIYYPLRQIARHGF